jgi:uncharacterized protein with PQ loop repeat
VYEAFLSLLPGLYGSVAFVALAGYVPQIWRLARSRSAASDVSLATWLIWLYACVVSLAYGVFILRDPLFCLVTGANLAGHLGVIGLAVYNRYFRRRDVPPTRE